MTALHASAAASLNAAHYLGARGARARLLYEDAHGLITFSGPTARRLPPTWLELSRWCLVDRRGSEQWAACLKWLRARAPECSTVVSYSDPSVGHDGALYRACGWVWAPTWHVLREPPTGCGKRGGRVQRAKHRWVYLLRPDPNRADLLRLRDATLVRRYPWVGYTEPTWRRGVPRVDPLASRFRRWAKLAGPGAR